MDRNWTFGKKVGAGFAVSGLILLLVVIIGYRVIDQLIENDRLVAHTHEVRVGIADIGSTMIDAETGQRGYVITGNDSYLEPYLAAINRVKQTTSDLRRLTADNAGQQRRLDAMSPLIDSKLAELKSVIDQRKAGGFDAASRIVNSNQGKIYMDQIRAILTEMDRDSLDLLAQRSQQAEATASTAKDVIVGGGIVGTLLVVVIGWFLTQSLTRQIGSAVQQVQSSAAELQAAANQQAAGSKVQARAMGEIATTINELLATSRQISESGQRVAQVAGQTTSASRSGEGTVSDATDSIGGIRRQVDLIVSHMLELGKKSQHIGVVLDIVSELAEQTNILAINATIEAAGAGDSGKRFGVVAEEIRKLADRVGGSTKEIRTLIEDVHGAVNKAVMATETGSKAVDAGSAQFGEVRSAFRGIADLVGTTTEAAREIELSTKQQNSAVEQVNVAINNVAQATKETEVSSNQTMMTASQLADLSKELLRLVKPHNGTLNGARSV